MGGVSLSGNAAAACEFANEEIELLAREWGSALQPEDGPLVRALGGQQEVKGAHGTQVTVARWGETNSGSLAKGVDFRSSDGQVIAGRSPR